MKDFDKNGKKDTNKAQEQQDLINARSEINQNQDDYQASDYAETELRGQARWQAQQEEGDTFMDSATDTNLIGTR